MAANNEITITRILNAPRERVFEAFTDPKQIVLWWGPTGFSDTLHEMDIRPGGAWRHTMHGPDGQDYPNYTIFREIVKPERIAYSLGGNKETRMCDGVWTFEEAGENKTKLTMKLTFPTAEIRDAIEKGHKATEGGNQTVDRLAKHLANADANKQIVISRIFQAPLSLVWKAFTEPKEAEKWWGPKGFTTRVLRQENRVGGKWEYVMHGPKDTEWDKDFPCHGQFIEFKPEECFVTTDEFGEGHDNQADLPKGLISTITFEKLADKKTRVTILISHPDAAERDKHEKLGVIEGWNSSLDCLEDYFTAK